MTITNNSLSQSFNAIFRDGNTYAESQLQVLVQKEGIVLARGEDFRIVREESLLPAQ